MLNQYDAGKAYYKLYAYETTIRGLARNFPTTYCVAILACCREIHLASKHGGCFGGTREEAAKQIKEQDEQLKKEKDKADGHK